MKYLLSSTLANEHSILLHKYFKRNILTQLLYSPTKADDVCIKLFKQRQIKQMLARDCTFSKHKLAS